jgi:hypothetical protein
MMKKLPEFVDLDGAVKLVMERTGKSRRQARQALLQKLKSGDVKSFHGEDHKPIPPEFFSIFPSEN